MKKLFWMVVCTVFLVLGWQGVSSPQELAFQIPEGWTPTTSQSPQQKVYAFLMEGNTVKAELILAAEEVPSPLDLNGYFRNVQQYFQSTFGNYTSQEVVSFQGQGISGISHTFLFFVQGNPNPLQGMLFLFPLGNTMYSLFFDCRAEDFASLEAQFLRIAQSLKATQGASQAPQSLPPLRGFPPFPQGIPQGERWTYQDARYSFSLPIPPGSTVAQTLDNGVVYQAPNQGQLVILRFDDEAGVQQVAAQVTQGKDFYGSSSLVTKNGSAVQVSLYSSRNPQTNIQYATLLGVFPGNPLLVVIVVPASEYQNAQERMNSVFTEAVVGQAQSSSAGGGAESEAMTYFFDGVQYATRGLYDEAISAYSKSIEIWPEFSMAYAERGSAYYAKGLYDEAIRDYTKALEIDPKLAGAYRDRGNAYSDNGLYEEAIADYTRALEMDPGDKKSYNNRGFIYSSMNLYEEAIHDYTKALEIDSEFAGAYFNKALVCEKVWHTRETVEAYKGFIEHAPPDFPYIEYARMRLRELE
ncbi:MAG: tetratricopeptide repeat protein [Candidatus Caldatribacteriaceae bacterium]